MLQKLSQGQRRTIAHWAMEFVVVVAGVLLALWLQEMVARAGRREAGKAAEDAIHAEWKIAEWKHGMKQYGVTLKPCAKPFVNPFAEQPRHS